MLLASGAGRACLSAARARGAYLPRPGAAVRLADECQGMRAQAGVAGCAVDGRPI